MNANDTFGDALKSQVLQTMMNSCDSDEQGVLVAADFSFLSDKKKPASVMNDILLISDKKGIILTTVVEKHEDCNNKSVEQYSRNISGHFDYWLKKGQPKDQKEKMKQFILMKRVTVASDNFAANELILPKEFQMDTEKLKALLYALVITLWQFESPFKKQLGVAALNVLTKGQFALLWELQKVGKSSKRKLFIHGLAGTGKTMVAVQMIKRLIKKYGHDSVLYVCENAPLESYVRYE